jgi:hypothetical protein
MLLHWAGIIHSVVGNGKDYNAMDSYSCGINMFEKGGGQMQSNKREEAN